jgi:hypothetical protein
MSRYATAHGPSVGVRWHKLPARRRGTEPRADHVNFLLLPWPLQIRASDFRPIEGSAQRDTDEPYGFFDFDPAERLDLDLVDRMLVATRNEVDSIDVVCLPESTIAEDELAPLEALLESHGVASLVTGVRRRRSGLDEFPDTGCTGARRHSWRRAAPDRWRASVSAGSTSARTSIIDGPWTLGRSTNITSGESCIQ